VGELSLGSGLRESGVFLLVGLGVGALLLVPLLHVLGVLFALALTGVGGLRLRIAHVLEGARGISPNGCGMRLTLAPMVPQEPEDNVPSAA
jgi:hypothetical protein